jgi:MFS superfamily sulfate permease-like transporter
MLSGYCKKIDNFMANKTSQHILSTAATLLGFCLFVITSMHIFNYSDKSIIDDFTAGIALSLISSGLFSFFSIRSKDPVLERRLEIAADYLFITALTGILIIILLIALHIIK